MLRILLRWIPLLLSFLGVIYSCEKPNQPQPQPENKPAITIPSQSQAVFNDGISFPTPSSQQENQPQTQTFTFMATESWTTSITDTKSSTWLTVEPSSGGAGSVNMTVKADPNVTDKARKATVSIKCGSTTMSFTVEQAAKPADPADPVDPAEPVEPVEPIAVTSISLNKKELLLVVKDSETLVATIKPDDATDKTVTWSSSNDSIATVDKNGQVTAVKEGAAVITAKAGEKSATCDVTVNASAIPVSGITLGEEELSLEVGTSFHSLYAVVSPVNATDKTVVWTNSDDTVIAISAEENNPHGLVVSALKEGTSTITATAGGYSATCTVTVYVVPVSSITLSRTEIELSIGNSTSLLATISPENATDKTKTWTSSDESIATVSASGLVTAVAEGKAIITVAAGDKTASCSVIVTKRPVTGISINRDGAYLYERESVQLSVWVNADATDQTATWTSSNPSVATVDASGLVTAIKTGETVISARVGEMTATCEVTVYANVSSISLNKTQLTLLEGDRETLTATLSPDEVSSWLVHWSSSDPSVATVNAAGYVTAIKAGTATITASAGASPETFKSASCIITVVGVTSIEIDKTSLSLEIGGIDAEKLTVTVTPGEASRKVIWSSSNPSVAIVDQSGNVSALREGSSVITAQACGMMATCTVNVTVAVLTVVLNKSELKLIEGNYEVLTATVYPLNATNKTVTWSSSNESIIKVDNQGKVEALNLGEAYVYATAGSKRGECRVKVVIEGSTGNPEGFEVGEEEQW